MTWSVFGGATEQFMNFFRWSGAGDFLQAFQLSSSGSDFAAFFRVSSFCAASAKAHKIKGSAMSASYKTRNTCKARLPRPSKAASVKSKTS